MKQVRQFLAIIMLSIVSVVLLSACGSNNNESSGKGVTINILQGKVENNTQFKQIAAQYEKSHPNIKVIITSVGGGSDYLGTLKTRMSAGDEPTIFSVAGPSEVSQFRTKIADVSDTKAAKLALPDTLDAVKEGKKILGLPFNLEGYGFVYNKEVFKKAGIDANQLKTYDQLLAAVKKLNAQKEKLGIKGVFSLPGQESWVMTNHLGNVFIAPDFNGNVKTAYTSKTLPLTRAKEYKRMLDLEANYSVGNVMQTDYSQQVSQYFGLHQVAMIQQGDWIYQTVAQIDPKFAKNGIGMIPIPVDGYAGKMPVGVPNYWAVNSTRPKKEQQAAKDFLDWLYTTDQGKKDVVDLLHFVPAYKGFEGMKMQDPLSESVFQHTQAKTTTGWVFNGYPVSWEADTLGPDVQKYLSKVMTWNELVTDAKQAWANLQSTK
ncbi:ABC transporter substrate-binding protein [Schleiferilactobacillus perolens]|jgi:raffinose/stachyose/melibiose transport system substrate-binding protein|uniref:ABC transporter substrate-binding protein n=1 Tax=Schleiferilactobacillus perolens TaxID=100468 RepID=UPI0023578C24|nr:ABC transporter substrate-binding protein [Schleiferilactobacillus perolens]MCI2170469.1 ABC transporter substrate-binding protein [Schleiferilactobacillus perolens]